MLAMQPLLRHLTEIVIHWHRLVHYMRGPGPKWHAKHHGIQ